jgi:hypothetical protein
MVHISEWMPNPAGSDAGEWVELLNDGKAPVNLAGWSLKTSKGKAVALRGEIPAGGYIVLKKSDFKFALRNTDETLSLYQSGKLADQSSFHGVAVSGKSVAHSGTNSFFAAPTPAAPNAALAASLINEPHPFNVSLTSQPSLWRPFGEAVGTSLLLAFLVIFIIQQFDGLSELFFESY